MNIITTNEGLSAACKRLAAADFVTVDTEFMRESTFWPDLCLIQIASEEAEYIIDPLANGIDLRPFFDLMGQESITKVFHAARQDIEIIHKLSGTIPKPLFDTQVAAMVCGFGESVSYVNLVKKITGSELDKSSRFTDWRKRPLSDKQTRYAMGDVTHLRDIYRHLKATLEKTGRASWLMEEMGMLTSEQTYISHPEDSWKRLKMRVRKPRALAIMMELAEWRERLAQSQNLTRGRIMKDEAIYDIANQAPRTREELANLRTISKAVANSARGRELLAAVERGLARDVATLPKINSGRRLPVEAGAIVELLRVLLKACAATHGVAPKLIANAADLEKIAVSDKADVPAMHGWRYDLFGRDALALKRGKTVLGIKNGRITAMALPSEDI